MSTLNARLAQLAHNNSVETTPEQAFNDAIEQWWMEGYVDHDELANCEVWSNCELWTRKAALAILTDCVEYAERLDRMHQEDCTTQEGCKAQEQRDRELECAIEGAMRLQAILG